MKNHKVNDSSVGGTTAESSAFAVLHQDTFSDPYSFMKILDKDRQLISPTSVMTKDQLLLYSEHGADPEARKAAELGYKYFDDLKKFANIPGADPHVNEGISHDDLKIDMDLYSGKVGGEVSSVIWQDAGHTALMGSLIFPTLMIAAGAEFSDLPPLMIAAGVMAAGVVSGTAYAAYGMYADPKEIHASAEKEHNFFANLPEFE